MCLLFNITLVLWSTCFVSMIFFLLTNPGALALSIWFYIHFYSILRSTYICQSHNTSHFRYKFSVFQCHLTQHLYPCWLFFYINPNLFQLHWNISRDNYWNSMRVSSHYLSHCDCQFEFMGSVIYWSTSEFITEIIWCHWYWQLI